MERTPTALAPPGAAARERLIAWSGAAERRVEAAGIATPVLETGDGPPLVLLHGPGEHAPKWLRVLPALAATHRVVAPDLPGHGGSSAGGLALDAGRTLDWLDALIDATCDAPPVLVGQILGGAIAARFAARRPGRIGGLALVDALGLVPFAPAPEFGRAMTAYLAGPGGATHDGLWRVCAHDLDRLRGEMGERWEALRAYNLDRAAAPEAWAAMGALMGAFAMEAIPDDELDRIAAPVALIWGRHDLATPLARVRPPAARRGWPLHVIEDAGDDPPLERPEAFVRALREALAGMG